MRGLAILAALVVAGAGVALAPGTARAECPWFAIPPATEAVRSAREVIVGTVVENLDGSAFTFRLRVDHVLRGSARIGETRLIDQLYPGWPFAGVDDQGRPWPPCEPIPGWKGNVIALALEALAPDGKTRYNAASWIEGRLPFNREVPRTTLGEMRQLAGLPSTDTAPSTVPRDQRFSPAPLIAIGLPFLVACCLVLRRGKAGA